MIDRFLCLFSLLICIIVPIMWSTFHWHSHHPIRFVKTHKFYSLITDRIRRMREDNCFSLFVCPHPGEPHLHPIILPLVPVLSRGSGTQGLGTSSMEYLPPPDRTTEVVLARWQAVMPLAFTQEDFLVLYFKQTYITWPDWLSWIQARFAKFQFILNKMKIINKFIYIN